MRALTTVLVLLACTVPAAAHQLLDRVVARVGTQIITWTDVEAALGLDIIAVDPGPRADQEAVERMIDRELILMEVARFPPPEPGIASVDAQVAALRQAAGADLDRLMRTTGLDDRRLRSIARDNLRIQAYIDQRFGLSVQVTDDEVRQYYEDHRSEFVRDGVVMPFEQVEGLARQRAAAQRRMTVVGQWLRDLRGRAEITVVGSARG